MTIGQGSQKAKMRMQWIEKLTKKQRQIIAAIIAAVMVAWTAGTSMLLGRPNNMVDTGQSTGTIAELKSEVAEVTLEAAAVDDKGRTDTVQSQNQSQTEVKVDGKRIVTPKNGSVHRVYKSGNGKTQINISSRTVTSGSDSSSSSTNLNVSTSTQATKSSERDFSP